MTLRSILGAVAVLAATSAVSAAGFGPIEVRTQPIASFPVPSGSPVEFRGGLVMTSSERAFGSWSGLDFSSDGQTLYAIADDGDWLSLRLAESGGRLVGIEGARLAPLLDDKGQPIVSKVQADAEGLRIVKRNGVDTAIVSFEQIPDVRVFRGPDFVTARPTHVALPRAVQGMADNLGLEALAVAPSAGALAGGIVVIAEHFLDREGNHRGFILDGPRAGALTLRRSDDFDVSDAAFLPNGDLLVLERKFGFLSGFAMRIRQIPAAMVVPGALLDGPVLLRAESLTGVDNMEGMAVRPQPDGGAVIFLISDDNHSFLQRTILLAFATKPLSAVQPLVARDTPTPP